MQKKKALKWLGIGLGGVLGLLVLLAILVPLFVDVDTYRPEIVSAAEKKINGKLTLGKLSLSLWGSVRVNVDGIGLSDAAGHKVIAAKDVFFHVPFWSVLTGAPRITFTMNSPEVHVHREPDGALNVSTLMKTTGEAPEEAPSNESEGETKLPGIVAAARLGISMRNATVAYEDKKAGLNTQVKDLNVVARNLSLSSPSDIEIWANLDTALSDSLKITGPVRLTASAKPEVADGAFKEAFVDFKVDVNDLVIDMKGTFEKPKGVEAWVAGQLVVGTEHAACKNLELRFHNASLKGSGEVRNLKTPPMILSLNAETPSVELAPWKKLVPALRPYDLGGTIGLKARASGPLDTLDYQADLNMKSATFSGANLLTKPVVDATIQVRPERIEKFQMTVKAPANDLRLSGSVHSFKAPKLSMAITSKGMDLDQLIKFEDSATKKDKASPKKSPASQNVDFDSMLAPVRSNALLKKASGTVTVSMAGVRMMGVAVSNIQSKLTVKNLLFKLEKFGLGVFSGKVTAGGAVNLQKKMPSYGLKVSVAAVDLKQAVESQFAPFKNTLVGKGTFEMNVNGKSFNPPAAKANLSGSGTMRVNDAKFNTIDVGRVATEAINKALMDVAAKVPQLKGQTLNAPKAVESEYESVTAKFTIKDGQFSLPDFFAKAIPNRGIDVRGNTQVNLLTDALAADWELRDTHNTLKARDMSVKIAGTVVPQILAKDGVVTLPVQVRGTVVDPKVTYTSVPEALAKVALDNIKRAAEQRVKSEVKNAAEKEVKKIFDKGLKGLFK